MSLNEIEELNENEETLETPDRAIEEISRLIKEGYTSGILDDENSRTVWTLEVKTFSTN